MGMAGTRPRPLVVLAPRQSRVAKLGRGLAYGHNQLQGPGNTAMSPWALPQRADHRHVDLGLLAEIKVAGAFNIKMSTRHPAQGHTMATLPSQGRSTQDIAQLLEGRRVQDTMDQALVLTSPQLKRCLMRRRAQNGGLAHLREIPAMPTLGILGLATIPPRTIWVEAALCIP